MKNDTCSVEDCQRLVVARGWCCGHYGRWHRNGDIQTDVPLGEITRTRRLCDFPNCGKPSVSHGLCNGHREQRRAGNELAPLKVRRDHGEFCEFPDCGRPYFAYGLCGGHRWQQTNGKELAPLRERAPRGSGHTTKQGYRMVRVNGEARQEHHVVMESILGRRLIPGETVHHLNGQRDQNNPENLELWSKNQPPGQRVVDKLQWAYALIELYKGTDEDTEARARVSTEHYVA